MIPSITVVGLNSRKELALDIDTLKEVIEWYVKFSPIETRSLEVFSRVVRLHDSIQDLRSKELDSTEDYIQKKLDGLAAGEILNESN